MKHVLFDFGGPLVRTPFELNECAEQSMGLPSGSLPRGPFDPATDVELGVLEPDPRAYELGIAAVGAIPSDIVFVDDQAANVTAASDAGLVGVWFDVTDIAGSVVRIRSAVWNGQS